MTRCVIASGSRVLCIEGAPEQCKLTLKMHHLSGWELISLHSLALCLEHSTSDFVKYFLWNHRGHNFAVILLKTRRECAKTKLSKDAASVSSSSAHTEEHYQVWEQGSHYPAELSWRFLHAIRRNYVVPVLQQAQTHKICGQLKIKWTNFTWLAAQFVTEILCNKDLVSIALQWLVIFHSFRLSVISIFWLTFSTLFRRPRQISSIAGAVQPDFPQRIWNLGYNQQGNKTKENTRDELKNYSRNLSIEVSADLTLVGLLFTSLISHFKCTFRGRVQCCSSSLGGNRNEWGSSLLDTMNLT